MNVVLPKQLRYVPIDASDSAQALVLCNNGRNKTATEKKTNNTITV
jgi:hypothetical protein